jgi:polyribonucleotide nucleotidyltransferase
VQKFTDVVKEGDKVKVRLLGFDESNKVRLSMKIVEAGDDLEAKQKADSQQSQAARRRRGCPCERDC